MDEEAIVNTYTDNLISLRELAKRFDTNHHMIKRILIKNGVAVTRRNTPRVFTKEHRENISKSCMGRKTWSKGKKMTRQCVLKNMKAHLRFDVPYQWLMQFDDIEKLKFLNKAITPRDIRFKVDTKWYQEYILRFYYDKQFNNIYSKWLSSDKQDRYLMPTIDHINPRSKNGDNDLDNLCFLTWFENRAKNDMTLDVWQDMKARLKEYLI